MAMAPLPFDGDGAVLRWSFRTEQALSFDIEYCCGGFKLLLILRDVEPITCSLYISERAGTNPHQELRCAGLHG
jgi:hypothetical protein